ncbi:MAG: hypothetical protein PHU68_00560 [Paludibacter sp.]|nr:hypothetical protein [Paludibacter sp.]
MRFPLNEFESYIEEPILKRGLQYFRAGKVCDCQEVAPGLYQGVVEGSELYSVELTVDKGMLERNVCSCPYDQGPVCKHVAACLFFLMQEDLGISVKKPTRKATPKVKLMAVDPVEEVLAKLSHDSLRDFVADRALNDEQFKAVFLSHFSDKGSDSAHKEIADAIKRIFVGLRNSRGWIDATRGRAAARSIQEWIDRSATRFKSGDYGMVFVINTTLLDRLNRFVSFTDDSSAIISPYIYTVLENLYALEEAPLGEKLRKKCYAHFVKKVRKGEYAGWDWHLSAMRIASRLARTPQEYDELSALLEVEGDTPYKYLADGARVLKYDLMKRMKGEAMAEEFMAHNLAYPGLRRMALDAALAGKQYEKGIRLAMEGMEQHKDKAFGLYLEWVEYLFAIALAMEDVPNIIQCGRYLLMESYSRARYDYYAELKKQIAPADWNAFVDELIDELWDNHSLVHEETLELLLLKEERWESLLQLLRDKRDSHPSSVLSRTERFEQYLAGLYPEELALEYREGIFYLLTYKTGRDVHQLAVKYLRRMIKLGQDAIAETTIRELRSMYSFRPTLLQELEKV